MQIDKTNRQLQHARQATNPANFSVHKPEAHPPKFEARLSCGQLLPPTCFPFPCLVCLPWPKSTSLSGSFIAGFPSIRSYLRDTRGISDYVIDRHLLGWNGFGIIVPIIDRDGNLTFRKLAKDPEGPSDRPKMLAPTGSHAKLYDWQTVLTKPESIVICEGEFDKLVL